MATVKLKYSSNTNITFHGVVDTGIERDDWNAMEEATRTGIVSDAVWDLIEIDEAPDDAEEY